MTFYQRKVHEDVVIRETCAITIRDAILSFRKSLTKLRTEDGIEDLARSIHQCRVRTRELHYKGTNENKCMYYSLFCSDHRKVADHFQLGLVRRVEAWSCLIYCNGPDKHHQFFQHLRW